MNEGAKTGLFWGAALVTLLGAAFVAWPTASDDSVENLAGQDLFEKFTDPLAADSMKIVTFDEQQGRLETFEVRRDRVTGLWTIPSRDGYPADAVENMQKAANAFIALKILDIQTSNAEDHDELGVSEPRLEDLDVGDVGVGRMVTFKNESQDTLASLIIGDPEKDDPEKRYVRIPGQDPVYVVRLDESSLTTSFEDWIESDLLQLSSINIDDMEIKDYSASISLGNQITLARNYAATVQLEGSDWILEELLEYDPDNPVADPTPVDVGGDQTLNATKLNEIKDALDDLKIANVRRKPDGMSANLRANEDFMSDNEAITSLAKNGFFPVPIGPTGEVEILSANGELSVTTSEGVKYVMRFGNISGVEVSSESDAGEGADGEGADGEAEDGKESDSGINRYLLVTTMVDMSKFPAPELSSVPKTLEELDVILNPPDETASEGKPEVADESAAEAADAEEEDSAPADDGGTDEQAEPDSASENSEPESGASENSETDAEGETESSGGGEVTGSGTAQDEAAQEEAAQDEAAQDETAEGETISGEPESTDQESPSADQASDSAEDESASTDEEPSEEDAVGEELSEEELLERLEAEQEKITKENQRKLDERKDKIEAAERRVRELNGRFADWYYVIAESTYSKLRIKRDELFESRDEDESDGSSIDASGPENSFPTPGQ